MRKLAHRTQFTGSLAFGWANNNEDLLPFTINSALTQFTLPRSDRGGLGPHGCDEPQTSSRGRSDDWRFSGRFRSYDLQQQHAGDDDHGLCLNYDTSPNVSLTNGPELYAHTRNTLDTDATWTGLRPVALTFGYTNNHNGYDARIFGSSNENVIHLKADAVGLQMVTFRAHYQYGSRTGSDLDEALLVEIGEQPGMRHYDLANRTRNQLTGEVDVTPNEALTLSFSLGLGKDNYPRQHVRPAGGHVPERSRRAPTIRCAGGVGVGGTYNYERYGGLQISRSASPGAEFVDPNRDWTTDSRERVNYFSVYVNPPRIGTKTEMRVSYDYAYAYGDYFYTVGPALPTPSQLPETYNKLQDFRFDVRHRVNGRMAATLSYVYEPYRIFDFAFDPSVINSIVQPSSLVLGYTYRPYTAHTAVFGIQVPTGEFHWRRRGGTMQRLTTTGGLFITALTVACVLGVPRVARSQDAEKKGEQVYAAQKCSVCHSIAGKGGKAEPARRRWIEALG